MAILPPVSSLHGSQRYITDVVCGHDLNRVYSPGIIRSCAKVSTKIPCPPQIATLGICILCRQGRGDRRPMNRRKRVNWKEGVIWPRPQNMMYSASGYCSPTYRTACSSSCSSCPFQPPTRLDAPRPIHHSPLPISMCSQPSGERMVVRAWAKQKPAARSSVCPRIVAVAEGSGSTTWWQRLSVPWPPLPFHDLALHVPAAIPCALSTCQVVKRRSCTAAMPRRRMSRIA